MTDIFQEIDDSVKNIIAPSVAKVKYIIEKVRYILDRLGEKRGLPLRKRTEYKSGPLRLVEKRRYFTRHYQVFYKGKLVLYTNDWDKVHRFRDGPWVNELAPLYLRAKTVYLRDAFGIDYLDELCDHFDHDEGSCSKFDDKTCPCTEFSHKEGSPD